MVKAVDAMALRKNFGQYVNETYYRGDEFIIKRAGKPVAALVPLADLEKITSLKAQGFKTLQSIWAKNKRLSTAAVSKDVAEAIREVRKHK